MYLSVEDIEPQRRNEKTIQVIVRWCVVIFVSHFKVVIIKFKNTVKLHILFLSKTYLSFCLTSSAEF
jgi:hypothetical protein